jgi:plasmid stabilization system protein ParE
MTYRVVFAPEAEAQLVALYLHMAEAASPEIAAKYTEDIVKECESLRTLPHRGTRRDYIRAGLRTFGFRRRITIAFKVADDVVAILGVFYGGRDLEKMFEEE